MRDILLTVALLFFIYYIFKKPFIGVFLSVWASLYTPSLWVYGFSSNLRINMVITIATFLALLFNRKALTLRISSSSLIVLLFFIWGTLSSIFNKSDDTVVWVEWNYFWKTILLYFLIIITINTEKKIIYLLWSILLSVNFIGAFEALKFIASGGNHVIEGVLQSKLHDRNALALSLNMTLLFIIYLSKQTSSSILKSILYFIIFLNIVAILGSYSRGGLIGLSILAIFYTIQSKHKIKIIFLSFVIIITSLNLLPERWFHRMDTIQTATNDESFLGRVAAWKEAILIANDYPVLGIGFKGGQNLSVWKYYEPDFYKFDFIVDTSGIEFTYGKAAHSIYFQVLGDLGYVGLLIFLTMIYIFYKKLGKLGKQAPNHMSISDIAILTKVSLVCYLVAGAALSLPYFDLLFIILGLTQCLENIKRVKRGMYNA